MPQKLQNIAPTQHTRVRIHWDCVYRAREMPSTNKHLQPSPTCRKAKVLLQPSAAKLCSLTVPLSFRDPHGYGSSSLLRSGIRLSTTLVATPLLGGLRSKVGSSSLFLQHNSLATQHFPTEGPPNAWMISLFSFPRLQSISPASPVSWKAAGSCFTEEFLLRKPSTLEPFPSVPTSTLV